MSEKFSSGTKNTNKQTETAVHKCIKFSSLILQNIVPYIIFICHIDLLRFHVNSKLIDCFRYVDSSTEIEKHNECKYVIIITVFFQVIKAVSQSSLCWTNLTCLPTTRTRRCCIICLTWLSQLRLPSVSSESPVDWYQSSVLHFSLGL